MWYEQYWVFYVMNHWIILKPTLHCILTRIWTKIWKKKKKVTFPFPTPWRRFCYPSLGGQTDVHKLFRILLYRKFASSPFIYLIVYQYGLIGIYFILGGIIQHYVTYFFTQVVSALAIGNSFSLVVCPFDNAPLFCFSEYFFLVLQDAPGSSYILPAQDLESAISSKSYYLFYWRTVFGNIDLGVFDVHAATAVSLILHPFSRQLGKTIFMIKFNN